MSVPCIIVMPVSDVVVHPQTQAIGMFTPLSHPDVDGFQLLGLPMRLDGWRSRPTGLAPPLPTYHPEVD